jgi:hypothetical protein
MRSLEQDMMISLHSSSAFLERCHCILLSRLWKMKRLKDIISWLVLGQVSCIWHLLRSSTFLLHARPAAHLQSRSWGNFHFFPRSSSETPWPSPPPCADSSPTVRCSSINLTRSHRCWCQDHSSPSISPLSSHECPDSIVAMLVSRYVVHQYPYPISEY